MPILLRPRPSSARGYGISYVHLNRLGSADELGINGPQVIIGTVNQMLSLGGKLPPGFITTQSGFPASLDSPSSFIPVNANISYIPKDTRWPYVQTWFLSVQRELDGNSLIEVGYNGNHSSRLPIIADYNQALPNVGRPRWASSRAGPIRVSAQSPGSIRQAFKPTMVCQPASSIASRTACTS